MACHANSSDLGAKEVLTWESFGVVSRELAQQVVDSDLDPEIIIAVARGGPLPADVFSCTMGVRLPNVINVEFYTDVARTLPDPILLGSLLDVESISDRRLLAVGDVAGSGRTLRLVFDLLKNYSIGTYSVAFYDESCSEIASDYVWKCIDDWIVFPRSAEPPVQRSRQFAYY